MHGVDSREKVRLNSILMMIDSPFIAAVGSSDLNSYLTRSHKLSWINISSVKQFTGNLIVMLLRPVQFWVVFAFV